MSAQVIDALRRRADALENGAREIEGWIAAQSAQGLTAGTTRDPEMLRFLAEQFRKLATDAEGREPQAGPERERTWPNSRQAARFPRGPEDGDEVPALLSEGCVYMTPREADALDRSGVTPEMLARLNAAGEP